MVKYSLLIPSKGGMPYLEFAVNSVLQHHYADFELLVSVATDEADALSYLSEISDTRLRLLHPPLGLSMAEHWDWLQLSAQGQWQMYLGQDDGVQGDFFDTAETLVTFAEELGIKAIASRRAYLHWPGSYFDRTGEGSVERRSRYRVHVETFGKATLSALTGPTTYFNLPQMYTTSLFHASIIDRCRAAQGGNLLTCHPQDANLAALANAFERRYLFSEVPLGWVGSSTKSAGLALYRVAQPSEKISSVEANLARKYIESVGRSKHQYPDWAGEFSLGSPKIYFWQALLMTRAIQDQALVEKLSRPGFIAHLLAAAAAETMGKHRQAFLIDISSMAKINGVHLGIAQNLLVYRYLIERFSGRSLKFLKAVVQGIFFRGAALGESRWSSNAQSEPSKLAVILGKASDNASTGPQPAWSLAPSARRARSGF